MSERLRQTPTFESREAYYAWLELGVEGRTELVDGEVVYMAAERVRHTLAKGAAYRALYAAIEGSGLDYQAVTDGITVEVGTDTAYEPDALVHCGQRLNLDGMAAGNPVIIVEVTSPSNDRREMTRKFSDYFSLPSVRHYLTIMHDRPMILHHRKDAAGEVHTAFVTAGAIAMDPPGITIQAEDLLV